MKHWPSLSVRFFISTITTLKYPDHKTQCGRVKPNNSSSIVGALNHLAVTRLAKLAKHELEPASKTISRRPLAISLSGARKTSNIFNMEYHYRRANQQYSLLDQTIEQADLVLSKR